MRNSPDLSTWRKSTYSGGGGNECLEIADAQTTLVRDSKTPQGPILTFRPQTWTAFVEDIKHPAH